MGVAIGYLGQVALRVLEEAAARGATCPPNTDLVVSAMATGTEVLARLECNGLVRVERQGRRRRVQIVSTGQWTDWSLAGRAAARQGLDDGGPKMSADEIAARRVDRDPCPRCATRPEYGCAHRRPQFGFGVAA